MIEDRQTTYKGVNYKLKKYQTRADKLKGHSGTTVWAPQGSDDRDPSKYIFPNEKKFQEIDKAFWPGAQSGSEDDIDPSRLSQSDQERYDKLELELITVPTKDKREVEAKMEKIWQNHLKREKEKKMKKESLDEAKSKKIKYRGFNLEFTKDTITAYDADGEYAAELQLWLDVREHKGKPYIGLIEVEKKHRRKGLASFMYDWAEKIYRQPLVPSVDQTPEAYKLWQKRLKKKESLDEAKKKKKKKCKKCYGYGCYHCGYRGWAFAPFYGKGDGTSAAAISTGPSGSGGGPAFPGPGGVNAPGVPGGANSGMGSSMSYDGNTLLADINVIGRLCERTE